MLPLFSAIYLTLIICISSLSVVVKMIILNIYHKSPLTPVPKWLNGIKQYITCRFGITRVADISENPQQATTKARVSITDEKAENRSGKRSNGNDDAMTKVCKCTRETMRGAFEEAMREDWQSLAQSLVRAFFIILIAAGNSYHRNFWCDTLVINW